MTAVGVVAAGDWEEEGVVLAFFVAGPSTSTTGASSDDWLRFIVARRWVFEVKSVGLEINFCSTFAWHFPLLLDELPTPLPCLTPSTR